MINDENNSHFLLNQLFILSSLSINLYSNLNIIFLFSLILPTSIDTLSKHIHASFYFSSIYFINLNIFYESIIFKKFLIFSRNYLLIYRFSSISISISQLYYISIPLKQSFSKSLINFIITFFIL